jgi:predicted acylesterase/phospholipase RssA/CRP-like cAMP-binding protein
MPLFAGLDPAGLEEVAREMQPRQFAANEVICRQGDFGDSLFMLRSGLALVENDGPSGPRIVGRLRLGDVTGEMSLLSGAQRSATVVAAVPTDVLELSRRSFTRLLARWPAILVNLSRLLSQRLARANVRADGALHRGEAVALVLGIRGRGYASAVVEAMRAASPHSIAVIDLGGCLGGPGSDVTLAAPTVDAALTALDDQLAHHGEAVVVADASNESLRALAQQMDRVVILATAWEADELSATFKGLNEHVDVVLLAQRPSLIAVELSGGLRASRTIGYGGGTQSVAWLGRHLTRTKLGLALGAGGAKGFAHIGALRVLERAGYTVDYVAGSSIGALVGAWIGMGLDADAIERRIRATFTAEHIDTLFRWSRGGTAERSDEIDDIWRAATEDATFDDLRIPVVVMTVDLVERIPAPISEGPVWLAIKAATSIAGLYPPCRRGSQLLVDGVSLVPVPTDAVIGAGADVTLSVNLMSRDTLPAWPGPEQPPTGDGRLVNTGLRMLDSLLAAMDLAQVDASERHAARADVVVTPRFGPGQWRDFHLAEWFLNAGCAAAEAQLAALARHCRPQPRSVSQPSQSSQPVSSERTACHNNNSPSTISATS